jgi:hypothetical protein
MFSTLVGAKKDQPQNFKYGSLQCVSDLNCMVTELVLKRYPTSDSEPYRRSSHSIIRITMSVIA